ncbi:MAG TPA: 23S rRNA (adenine(2503)-C(2))-methyltransferase RlmN [Clostridiales bacterium]|nr:23S rRNA (adenine(2503)-C(2))-methyltransferase RlmN [Clostridiales bacterium]
MRILFCEIKKETRLKLKESLLGFSLDELKKTFSDKYGEKTYRAGQVFTALNGGLGFSEMTNLSLSLRKALENDYSAVPVKIIETLKSKEDGTEKFLFLLDDGNVIEGVLMRYEYGATLCVSTQVGCRMNCAFCASGLEGLIRNLTSAEILGEVVAVNKYLGGGLKDKRAVTNVVLMGSGEPLDNYDNVIRFLRLLSCADGLNISARNVSLSTSGIVPKMYELAKEGLPVNLTVSLHSPFDEERKEIMPIAKVYSIKQILDACSAYFDATGRRYIFEYVLIAGKNDGERHSRKLIELLKGRPCHVNIIRLNEVKERTLVAATDKAAYRFAASLEKAGISATVRRRMGADIDGACGQLRRRYLGLDGKSEIKNG